MTAPISKFLVAIAFLISVTCRCEGQVNGFNQQEIPGQKKLKEGSIPIRMVGGHLLALVDLSANGANEEFALLIDFQADYELSLVKNAAKRLKLEEGFDNVQLEFASGFKRYADSADVVPYTGPLDPNEITKYHIGDLDEHKVAGALGSEFFEKYRVTIDIHGKQILLENPKSVTQLEELGGDFVVSPIRSKRGVTYLPIILPGEKEAEIEFGTNVYDTMIDKSIAKKVGKPAGDIGSVFFKTEVERAKVDLAKYVAFRPSTVNSKSDSVALVTGNHLLSHFRITLDWTNKYAVFTQTKSANFPKQDLAFFKAENAGTSKAVLSYLEKYPSERLSKLAAELAVERLVKEKADSALIYKAIEMVVNLTEAQRRSVTCLEYFEPLQKLPGSIKLLQKVGDLGLKHSNKAIDGFTAYDIHVQLGLLSQENGELKRAWEHLLSATFGRPDDFRAVVALGKVYEKQGRFRRAYSRFKKVATYVPLPNPNDEFLPPDVLNRCISDAKKGMKRLGDMVPDKDK